MKKILCCGVLILTSLGVFAQKTTNKIIEKDPKAITVKEYPLKSFRGSSWYLAEIIETPKKGGEASHKEFSPGEHSIVVDEKGTYKMKDFLSIKGEVEGHLIEDGRVLIFSNSAKDNYFWVFEEVKKMQHEVIYRYIPYEPSDKKIEVRLRPNKTAASSSAANIALKPYDFGGNWAATKNNGKAIIQINQVGSKINGTIRIEGTTSKVGFAGDVNGKEASVDVFDAVTGAPLGKATFVNSAKDQITLEVTENLNPKNDTSWSGVSFQKEKK